MTQIMVQLDANNIVIGYGICLNEQHEPIPNGVKIETDLDLNVVVLKDNYKLVDSALVELAESEKPIVEPQQSELEILREENEQLKNSLADLWEVVLIGGTE